MVIDDDAMVLESLEAILTEWGYQAIAAVSAEEAVAQVRELGRRPDIVIADYRLQDGPHGHRGHSRRPRPVRPPHSRPDPDR